MNSLKMGFAALLSITSVGAARGADLVVHHDLASPAELPAGKC